MRHLRRRSGIPRRLLWGLLALVGVVVLAVGGALLALQTSPGRRLVEHQVEERLGRLLQGRVDLGHLEGSLVRRVVAVDVVVHDAAGREALRIPRLEFSYDLLALLGHVVRLRDVQVIEPVITARRDRDGKLDLAGLLAPPGQAATDTEPSRWRLVVRNATLTRGHFSLDGVRVDGLELALSLVQRGTHLAVRLDRARGRWVEKDLTVEGKATLRKDGDAVEVADLVIQAGESRLQIPRASGHTDGSQLQAEVALEARRADVLRFVSQLPLPGDLRATGKVSRATPGQPFQARLQGTLGDVPWNLDARIGIAPPALAGSFRIRGVDPAAVWAAAPAGRTDVVVTGELAGRSLRTLAGTARLEARGQVGGHRAAALIADLAMADGVVSGRVQGRAAGTRAVLEGAIDLVARPPVVRSARLQARITRAGRLAEGLGVQGVLAAELTARGPLDRLRVTGRVRGTAVSYQGFHATTVAIEGDVAGLPGDPVGRATLEATGVTRGTLAIGAVTADGDFRDLGRRIDLRLRAGAPDLPYDLAARTQIDRSLPGRTIIRIGALSVRTRQLTWRGSAGVITLAADGGLTVKDVALASSAGRIQASGQLRVDGDRLDLAVEDLQIEELRRALAPQAPDVRGQVNARLSLLRRKHRTPEIETQIVARDLVLRPGTAPISLDLEASLRGRALVGTLALDGGAAGAMALDLQARGPVDPFDLEAWRRLDACDLRELHARLTRLDLSRLRLGPDGQLGSAGLVDAVIDAGPGVEAWKAELAIAGLVTAEVDRPVSVRAELNLADSKLHLAGRAQRDGGGAAEATARLALPPRLCSVDAWRGLGLGDVELARLSFDALGLSWFPALRRRYPDVEGNVSGTVTALGRRGGEITVDLRLDRVRAGSLRTPLSARLRTSLFPGRSSFDLESSLAGRSLATVRGTIDAGLAALRARKTEAFLTAAINANLLVQDLPLAVIGQAIAQPVPAEGTVEARATLSGALRNPIIDAQASLHHARIGTVGFPGLRASGHLERKRLAARLDATQDRGGSFETKIEVNLGDPREGRLMVKAARFDLGFLASFATDRGLKVSKGHLDADVSIAGTAARHQAGGWIKLSGGDLRLVEALGTFHEANLSMRLGPGDAVAATLGARVGSHGSVKASGTARLIGLRLGEVQASFETHRLSVSAGGTRARVEVRGSLTGAPEADLYVLTTTFDEGTVSLSSLIGGQLHPTGVPRDVVFVDARGRREEAVTRPGPSFLRIRLRTRKPLLVTSDELQAEVAMALDLMVSPTGVETRGRVRIERGFATLSGRHWAFQPSTAVFGGASPPDPRLNIKLSYEFRATTVVIVIGGTLSKPTLQMSSSSGSYDQAQLLGFVLGGNPDDTGPAGQQDVTEQTLGAATGLLFGQLQPLLRKVVPVDVLSLQTKTGAREETVFSVGKWVLSTLFVAYEGRFSSQTDERHNTNEGKLEWYFARRFRLDLIFGDRGEGSADVLWIRRW